MNSLSCRVRMWAELSFVLSQSKRLTDGDGRLSHGYTVRGIKHSHSRTVTMNIDVS